MQDFHLGVHILVMYISGSQPGVREKSQGVSEINSYARDIEQHIYIIKTLRGYVNITFDVWEPLM